MVKVEAASSGMPVLHTGEMVGMIADFCTRALQAGLTPEQIPALFLWGMPGIGKSEGIAQAASQIEAATGKRVVLTDVRLLLFSPVDLRGIPVADPKNETAIWLKPDIFEMDASEDVLNILLLDELTAAPQSMQAAAYQIVLDRKIGEHHLPSNCLVMAAGNRTTDRSVAFQMPKALCSRLLHFQIQPDFVDWKKWAEKNDIDDRIIAFLQNDPSRLAMEPGVSDIAYPSPRTWDFASRILKMYPGNVRECLSLIGSAIGLDTAMEFAAFVSSQGLNVSLAQILKGECTFLPKSADQLFAICRSISSQLSNRKSAIKPTQADNLARYICRFPPDYALSLFQELEQMDQVSRPLHMSLTYKEWKKKYA